MSAAGVAKLNFIVDTVDQDMYINIYNKVLPLSADKIGLQTNFLFQQSNDPKHTAQSTKLWLLYNKSKQFSTPPQSPDLNLIVHLWY